MSKPDNYLKPFGEIHCLKHSKGENILHNARTLAALTHAYYHLSQNKRTPDQKCVFPIVQLYLRLQKSGKRWGQFCS